MRRTGAGKWEYLERKEMLGIKEGSEEVCRCREVLLESAGTERGVSSWDLPLKGVVGEIGDRRS